MSKIIPFKALLPIPEVAPQMLCPPYDVISSEEAREFAKDNPFSFLHITKSEIDLPANIDPYRATVYQKATDNLKSFEKRGYLVEREPTLYIYRQVMGDHGQTGIVCGASVDEYESGAIRRHEKTREEKVIDRTKHAHTARAHTEPVMLVHRSSAELKELINEREARFNPLYDMVDRDGVRHLLWKIEDPQPVLDAFAALDALYIADGHHRSEAARRVRDLFAKENPNHTGEEPYNYFPVVIFPDDEVRVFQYDWDGPADERPLSEYTMASIMELADRQGIMPPKSTWFAPKLGSGLFVYLFS